MWISPACFQRKLNSDIGPQEESRDPALEHLGWELGTGRKRKAEKLPELQITSASLGPRAKLLRIKHRRME